MTDTNTPERILEMARSFQSACVLAAAVDLEVFNVIHGRSMTASMVAAQIGSDLRATVILLDALAALELLSKERDHYSVPPFVADTLTDGGVRSVLSMILHQANCLRRWVQLPQVVQSGRPAERRPSIRGEAADTASFIGAMHTLSDPIAEAVVGRLAPMAFQHLLDIGGGFWHLDHGAAAAGPARTGHALRLAGGHPPRTAASGGGGVGRPGRVGARGLLFRSAPFRGRLRLAQRYRTSEFP